MYHQEEKEHIFSHLLKKKTSLAWCNFFFFHLTSQSCVISVMIEIRCRRGEEEEKYKVSRQSGRERAGGTAAWEREQSQARVELSVSQSAKSAWQPAGSPAVRRDTHSTLSLLCPQISCKLPLRKWVLWNRARAWRGFFRAVNSFNYL